MSCIAPDVCSHLLQNSLLHVILLSCSFSVSPSVTSGPRLVSGQGLDGTGETMRIHRENQAKLQGMSQSEILEEQRKLLSQLGRQSCCPRLKRSITLIVLKMNRFRV